MSGGRLSLAQRIEANWYRSAWRNAWLMPLVPVVWLLTTLKRRAFLRNPPSPGPVPVIVIGNITVGGTGKTPLITWLAERARAHGLRPAVVSRGYGGRAEHYPLLVEAGTPVSECGDEPRLLQSRLQCPVVVDPQRSRAVQALAGQADIIFSDDGLQHYAMARSAEIVVVDGKRRFGNEWLLPVGPLREPVERLSAADLVVANGSDFTVTASALVNAVSGQKAPLESLQGKVVHAVAGIGNPQRFYDTLTVLGASVKAHPFADHHAFSAADFDFPQENDAHIVMTEKDWVKCRPFAQPHWWYLQVDAVPDDSTCARLDALLQRFKTDY